MDNLNFPSDKNDAGKFFNLASDILNIYNCTDDKAAYTEQAIQLVKYMLEVDVNLEILTTVASGIEMNLKAWGLIAPDTKLVKAVRQGTLKLLEEAPAVKVESSGEDENISWELDENGEFIEVREPVKTAVAAAIPAALKVHKFAEPFPFDNFVQFNTKTQKDGSEVRTSAKTVVANSVEFFKFYGVELKYNIMTRKVEVTSPNFGKEDKAENKLIKLTDLAMENGYRASKLLINDHMNIIAVDNAYHPVRDWLAQDKWDGKSRMQDFFNSVSVKPEHEKLRNAALKRFAMMVAKAIYLEDKTKLESVLVFVGSQGLGKTTWINNLFSSSLEAVKDGKALNPHDKDEVAKITTCLVCELGELERTFKSEVGAVKAFLSSQVDEYRAPYAMKAEEHLRRTVFVGSVNKEDFLIDDTGNRRFLTVQATAINANHGIDMRQFWLEAKEMLDTGEQWWPTDDEKAMFAEANAAHELVSPIEQAVLDCFFFEKDLTGVVMGGARPKLGLTLTQVAEYIGRANCTKADLSTLKAALKKHTGQDGSYARPGVKGYQLYPLIDYSKMDENDKRNKFLQFKVNSR